MSRAIFETIESILSQINPFSLDIKRLRYVSGLLAILSLFSALFENNRSLAAEFERVKGICRTEKQPRIVNGENVFFILDVEKKIILIMI